MKDISKVIKGSVLRTSLFGLMAVSLAVGSPFVAYGNDVDNVTETRHEDAQKKPMARKLLVIGDSMTGWIGERMSAYGDKNGYEVATVVWDGSTIKKWAASSARLKKIISEQKPDGVVICLGMNELLEKNPKTRLSGPVETLLESLGDTPYVWLGPPSWPGKPGGKTLVDWLGSEVGKSRFFDSSSLRLARQSKTNPHPSRQGICTWVDDFQKWLPQNSSFDLPGYESPAPTAMKRGKFFLYRKMKESL